MKHKYLFLDLDGVINSSCSWVHSHEFSRQFISFDDFIREFPNSSIRAVELESTIQSTIQLLAKSVLSYGFRIVIISSWITSRHTYKDVNNLFQFFTGLQEDFVYDQSKYGNGGLDREIEVLDYIEEHKAEIESFTIIDDSGEKHFDKLLPYTVAPCGRVGMTLDDWVEAMMIAGAEFTGPMRDTQKWIEWEKKNHYILGEDWTPPSFSEYLS